MLNSWVFDGELFDKSFEFFIACDESSKQEKLWRSRYSLRHTMLPSFISKELAQKVCEGGSGGREWREGGRERVGCGGCLCVGGEVHAVYACVCVCVGWGSA